MSPTHPRPTKGEKWRVDTVPLWAKPFFLLYGYGLGFLITLLFSFLKYSCRQVYSGRTDALDSPYIGVLWHDQTMPYFTTILFGGAKKHVWLNHPDAYMKPIHVVIGFTGVEKLVLGSSGRGGKEASLEVVEYLKRGYSTMVNPDGPYGPKYEARKGAFHMSLQSGVPILPISLRVTPRWHWPSWDKKIMPFPFLSRIQIDYKDPIQVTEENFNESIEKLKESLPTN